MPGRRFLIDTDTASDDAVALVMALRHPDVCVEAITVVAGNVDVDQGVQNALYTVERCAAAVPVYRGAAAPLCRPLETAVHVHGHDGMGDIGLPLAGRSPAPGEAADVIAEVVNRHPGAVTLVTLGPLTNIARALDADPALGRKVASCVVMGGTGQGSGNITPVAEYNIWVDPEAAARVFAAGFPLTMVGWDIAKAAAVMTPDAVAALRAEDTPLAHFCLDIQATLEAFVAGRRETDWYTLPDPIAMAVALDPTVATLTRSLNVAVETESTLCRGQTVVDHHGVSGRAPNVNVVLGASREAFLRLLHRAVRA